MSRLNQPRRRTQQGTAMVLLLVFMAVAMSLTATAVVVTVVNTQATSDYSLGQDALDVAESGVDNAMMRLLRNPAYTGETMTISGGTATITVSGTTTKTITSKGTVSGFVRTVQAVVSQTNTVLTVTSWKETP